MSFATHHATARLPFRILALLIFLFSALGLLIGIYDIVSVNLTIIEELKLVGVGVMTLATGKIALTGRAPQWLISTRPNSKQ